MEFTGALDAARARFSQASHPSTSQMQVQQARRACGHHGRAFLWRNGGALCKTGAVSRSSSALPTRAILPRHGPLFQTRAQAAAEEEQQVVDVEAEKSVAVEDNDDDEDLGIDKDGKLTASLPEEFLELMKDEGPAPNYWLAGFALTVAFLARKSIWKEVKNWGKLVVLLGLVVVDLVVAALKKLIKLGGDPLASVIVALSLAVLTVHNFFRFIADIFPPGPILFAITLASIILLVGESVSDTYSSSEKQFPSRNILDTAGLLGLCGFVGLIPVEVMLLGLASITVFLLFVRKVNPVAGFTPVAAVFAAVATPVVRYPVFFSFVSSAVYRYWRLGYLSHGAVPEERTAEYPRVLIALLYLVGVAFAARSVFYVIDFTRAAIAVARA